MSNSPARSSRTSVLAAAAALCVALFALLVSMGGLASAKPTEDKGGATLLTTITGSHALEPFTEGDFALDGATFTQKPGQTVILVTKLSSPDLVSLWQDWGGDDEVPDACGGSIILSRQPEDGGFPETITIGNGGEWHGDFVYGITPPATTASYTMTATYWTGCEVPMPAGTTFTLDLEVAVLALG